MMHSSRRHCVKNYDTPEELSEKMSDQYTWTLCTGFGLTHAGRTLLYLNDATSEDGAGEFAVYMPAEDGKLEQIESVTFGWMSPAASLDMIRRLHVGTFKMGHRPESREIDAPGQHSDCWLCV